MTQQVPDHHPPRAPRPAGWQLALPWGILVVWLAADLAVVIYWAIRDWGFLEAVPLMIALLFHLVGLTAWLTAFAVLSACTWLLRAGYFIAGTIAVVAFDGFVFHFNHQPPVAIIFVAFLIGLALPFLILRRQGWKIAIIATDAADIGRPAKWQFSIGDLLLTTTLLAIILGLLLASGSFRSFDEIYVLIALLLGAPIVIVTSLAWRSFWLAALASSIVCTLLTLLPIAWHDSTRPTEAFVLVLIAGAPVVSQLAASGCLRRAGYRLN